MPEILETICSVFILNKYIKGTIIYEIELLGNSSSKFLFNNNLFPSKIEEIDYKGKLIIVKLNNNHSILIHCGLFGFLSFIKLPYSRLKLNLGSLQLYYNDKRNFGYVKLTRNDEVIKKLSKLGICCDSLTNLEKLNTNSNMNIASFLLDQKKISGIGNYLRAEILHNAKIHPLSITKNINKQYLINAIFETYNSFLKQINYNLFNKDILLFKKYNFSIYKQKLCSHGCIVEKLKLNNRYLYWSPQCQNSTNLPLKN